MLWSVRKVGNLSFLASAIISLNGGLRGIKVYWPAGEDLAGGGRGVGCYRPGSEGMLNAIEPGSPLPIHRHPTKDESFVILRGKVRGTTHNDEGAVIDEVVRRF